MDASNLRFWLVRVLVIATVIAAFDHSRYLIQYLFQGYSAGARPYWNSSPGFGSRYHGPKLVREIARQQLFGARIRFMLHAKQYDALEAMADSLLRDQREFPSGVRYLDAFFERGFAEVNDPGGDSEQWADLLQDLRDWNEASPNSVVARLAEVEGLIGRGLMAPDPTPAMVVSTAAMRPHVGNVEEALRILEGTPVDGALRATWFAAALTAFDLKGRQSDSKYRLTARAAQAEFPEQPRFYQSEARHLSPRCYGKRGEWAEFADTCASCLPDDLRDEIFARIVADQDRVTPNVFTENPALSWERTIRGLEAWDGRCPNSLEARSAMARLARDKGDAHAALVAFSSIGDSIDVDCWSNYNQVWSAHEWARTHGNPEQVAGK